MSGSGEVTLGAAPLGLPEAPVFRPSMEEFEDPLRYIASIRQVAEPYGICKIVPPEGWNPPFAIDKQTFKFPTRIQCVHELQDRVSLQAQQTFFDDFHACMRRLGKAVKKSPVFSGKEIDLFKMHRAVSRRGGYQAVTDEKNWKDIVKILQVPSTNNNASYGLRQIYQKYLLPYEEHCAQRLNEEQEEAERKRSAEHDEALEAAEILEALGLGMGAGAYQPDMDDDVLPSQPEPPVKKRKVSSKKPKAKEVREASQPLQDAPPTTPATDTGNDPSVALGTGIRVPTNIDVLVCELCKGGYHEDQIILCDSCDRGFHLFCLSPPMEAIPDGDWVCPLCLKAESDNYAFKPGYELSWAEFERHANAFRRNFWGGEAKARKATWEQLEAEFWRIVEEGESPVEVLYGADLDTNHYGSGFPKAGKLLGSSTPATAAAAGTATAGVTTAPRSGAGRNKSGAAGAAADAANSKSVAVVKVEDAASGKAVTAHATAGQPGSQTGVSDRALAVAGADAAGPESSQSPAAALAAYATHKWNVNNFPRLSGPFASMLQYIDDAIPGVMVPWLYVGMMFSSFCWHVEDHLFYSVNYHHWGDPKRWYSVPEQHRRDFEDAFRKAMPEQFETQPDLLFQLVTMLSPRILRQHDVPVYTTVQEAGNFIVTFPGAYHSGFNHGLNCAEAVNFAPADWWRFAGASLDRYQTFRKPPIICQDSLLLRVANSNPSPETARWLAPQLARMVQHEEDMRYLFWGRGVHQSRKLQCPVGMKPGDHEDAECATCRSYLHTMALECDCCPGRYVCLQHCDTLCECDPASWRLLYRRTLSELEGIHQKVSATAALLPPLEEGVDYNNNQHGMEQGVNGHALGVKEDPYRGANGVHHGMHGTTPPCECGVRPSADGSPTKQQHQHAVMAIEDCKASAGPTNANGQRGNVDNGVPADAFQPKAGDVVMTDATAASLPAADADSQSSQQQQQQAGDADVRQPAEAATVAALDTSTTVPCQSALTSIKEAAAEQSAQTVEAVHETVDAPSKASQSAEVVDIYGTCMGQPDSASGAVAAAAPATAEAGGGGNARHVDTAGAEADTGGHDDDDHDMEDALAALTSLSELADAATAMDTSAEAVATPSPAADHVSGPSTVPSSPFATAVHKDASSSQEAEHGHNGAGNSVCAAKPEGVIEGGDLIKRDEELAHVLQNGFNSVPQRRKLRSAARAEEERIQQLQDEADLEEAAFLLAGVAAGTPRTKVEGGDAGDEAEDPGDETNYPYESYEDTPCSPAHVVAGDDDALGYQQTMPDDSDDADDDVDVAAAGSNLWRRKSLSGFLKHSPEQLQRYKQKVQDNCRVWIDSAKKLLSEGGAKQVDLDILINEAQQYLWGGQDCEAARDLEQRLQAAKQWVSDVYHCSRSKASLEKVEALLVAWNPPPVAAPGLSKLREAVKAAGSWRARYQALLGGAAANAVYGTDGSMPGASAAATPAAGKATAVKQEPEVRLGVSAATASGGSGGIVGAGSSGGGFVREKSVSSGLQLRERGSGSFSRERSASGAAAMSGAGHVLELKALSSLASEGARLGLELPELKQLQDKLDIAKGLAQTVKTVLVATGDERADIPALRALQQQISSCGVALPETALLADMLDKAEGIQHKAKQSLLMRQTLEELTELVKEAASVPVYIPDMDTVEALISKAHDWLKRAAAAGHQAGGPLKAMRELLHSGERMGVVMPQIEELRQCIRKREWEESARRAMGCKATLSSLTEVLEEASKMGAAESDQAKAIQGRLDKALAWDAEATKLLGAAARVAVDRAAGGGLARGRARLAGLLNPGEQQTAGASTLGAPAVNAAGSSQAADVVMTDAASSSQQPAASATADDQQAEDAADVEQQAVVTQAELAQLVAEGQAIGVKLERLYEGQRLLNACISWQRAVEQLRQDMQQGTMPTADRVAALLQQATQTGISLGHVDDLEAVLEEGRSWASLAVAMLTSPPDEEQALGIEKLIVEGESIGLQFAELVALRDRLAALKWQAHVKEMFKVVLELHYAHRQALLAAVAANADAANAAAAEAAAIAAAAAAAAASGLGNTSCSARPSMVHSSLAFGVNGLGKDPETEAAMAAAAAAAIAEAEAAAEAAVASGSASSSLVAAPDALWGDATARAFASDISPLGNAAHQNSVAVQQQAQAYIQLNTSQDNPPLGNQPEHPQAESAAESPAIAQPCAAATTSSGKTPDAAGTSAPMQVDSTPDTHPAAAAGSAPAGISREAITNNDQPAGDDPGSSSRPPPTSVELTATEVLPEALIAVRRQDIPESEKADLEDAIRMLQVAQHLPVDEELRLILADAVGGAVRWEAKVVDLFPGPDGVPPLTDVDPGEVAELAREGGCMPFRLESVHRLRALLDSHQQWEERARAVLSAADNQRPPFDDLQMLADMAQADPIASELFDKLDELLGQVDDWRERCRRTLAKRNSQQKLDSSIEQIVYSIARVLEGLKQMHEEEGLTPAFTLDGATAAVAAVSSLGMKRPASDMMQDGGSSSGPRPKKRKVSDVANEDSDGKLYCVCLQPHDNDTYISCDACGDWYHLKCVCLTNSQAKNIKRWLCPVCCALKGDGDPMEASADKIRRTRRPKVEHIQSLLSEAVALKVVLHEEQLLSAALQQYHTWHTAVSDLLASHETARIRLSPVTGASAALSAPASSTAAAGTIAAAAAGSISGLSTHQKASSLTSPAQLLSDIALRSIVRQSVSVEVDADETGQQALKLLRAEGWRSKAEALLQGNTKCSLEQVTRILKEAEALGSDAESDPLCKQLSDVATAAKTWMDSSKEMLDRLKGLAALGKEAVARDVAEAISAAKAHLELAAGLRVKVDREFDKLSEASRPYCLCQSLYDERRPMIGCDYCNDWFHWECVGLSPPNDDQDDEEVAPADFKCPNCCANEGLSYQFLANVPAAFARRIEERAHAERAKRLVVTQGAPHQFMNTTTHKAGQYPQQAGASKAGSKQGIGNGAASAAAGGGKQSSAPQGKQRMPAAGVPAGLYAGVSAAAATGVPGMPHTMTVLAPGTAAFLNAGYMIQGPAVGMPAVSGTLLPEGLHGYFQIPDAGAPLKGVPAPGSVALGALPHGMIGLPQAAAAQGIAMAPTGDEDAVDAELRRIDHDMQYIQLQRMAAKNAAVGRGAALMPQAGWFAHMQPGLQHVVAAMPRQLPLAAMPAGVIMQPFGGAGGMGAVGAVPMHAGFRVPQGMDPASYLAAAPRLGVPAGAAPRVVGGTPAVATGGIGSSSLGVVGQAGAEGAAVAGSSSGPISWQQQQQQ